MGSMYSVFVRLASRFLEIEGPAEDENIPPEDKKADDEDSQRVGLHGNRLMDLPPEILTMIVEDPLIDLEDRKHLRATCKTMELIVAESDWKTDYKEDFYIAPANFDEPGPFGMSIPIFESGSEEAMLLKIPYEHAVGRLFRVAHFNTIFMSYLNFKPTESGDYEKIIDELLKLSTRLSCHHLRIIGCDERHHPRMFDVIKNIEKIKKLELDIPDVRIETTRILDLPPFDSLRLTSRETIFDDHVLLTLLSTHRFLYLADGRNSISTSTFLGARKLIEAHGHSLSLQLRLNVLLQLLGSFGIVMHGNTVACANPEISVASNKELFNMTHIIEMGETIVSFDTYNKQGASNAIATLNLQKKL